HGISDFINMQHVGFFSNLFLLRRNHGKIVLNIRRSLTTKKEYNMTIYPLIATAAAGIEALVGKELRDMGYEVQVENGRARFEGSLDDVAHTNINLRTADRIKIVMGDFKAITFDQLFE